MGITKSINCGRDEVGRSRLRTICGIMMHSSLAVTDRGRYAPWACGHQVLDQEEVQRGCNALKKKINPTRVPIEEKE